MCGENLIGGRQFTFECFRSLKEISLDKWQKIFFFYNCMDKKKVSCIFVLLFDEV